MKYKTYFFPLLTFILLNLYVIFNFGLYHDDWGFFVFNESFLEHSKAIWNTEGVELHRYPNVIFYIFGSLMPSKEFLYLYLSIFGLVICYQIYDIIRLILKKKNLLNDINKFGCLSLICFWYFYPFNIGGQIWSADLHVKVSFFFFLIHYQYLIRNKIIHSLIFLIIAFSSYEMFYLIFIPISFILFKLDIIQKEKFKKYLIFSIIIQLYFIFDRKRDYYEFELLDFIIRNILNIFRFFYSIHSSFASFLNIYFQILVFLPFFYFVYTIEDKKNFYKLFVLIFISLGLNSLILSGGHYGYTGQGVFSRSFYYAAVSIFLITLSIFLFNKTNKNKILFITYLFFLTFVSFGFESYSWIKSWKIQKKIIYHSKVTEINKNFNKSKNLIIFFGPCKYNGVEIFHAPWDIGRSIRANFLKSENEYLPITNWDIELNSKEKILGVHNFHYSYLLRNYNKIIYWDYFKDNIEIVIDVNKLKGGDLETINKFSNYRKCEIETDNYKKNLIDYRSFKLYLFNFF